MFMVRNNRFLLVVIEIFGGDEDMDEFERLRVQLSR
jgi:hypothetical protein